MLRGYKESPRNDLAGLGRSGAAPLLEGGECFVTSMLSRVVATTAIWMTCSDKGRKSTVRSICATDA
jgi:hypothetical protein